MTLQLATAIYARFKTGTAGAALRALITGMFPQQAPQEQKTPYVTFAFISSSTDWAMNPDKKHIDFPLVQFSAWDDQSNSDRVMAVGQAVGDLYDDALLSLAGFATIRADKIGERSLEEPDVKGFQYIVEMRYRIES